MESPFLIKVFKVGLSGSSKSGRLITILSGKKQLPLGKNDGTLCKERSVKSQISCFIKFRFEQKNPPSFSMNSTVSVCSPWFFMWAKCPAEFVKNQRFTNSVKPGNGWSIGWNTRSSTSMSMPKRRPASSCGVAWWNRGMNWGTRWHCGLFFLFAAWTVL